MPPAPGHLPAGSDSGGRRRDGLEVSWRMNWRKSAAASVCADVCDRSPKSALDPIAAWSSIDSD